MKSRISHIGIYVKDLEEAKKFFMKYFDAEVGAMYHNQHTGFKSYFLKIGEGSRLEIMNNPDIEETNTLGACHIAFNVGTKEAVDQLTNDLEKDGYEVPDGPRLTDDGYYENTVLGIDRNRIVIAI